MYNGDMDTISKTVVTFITDPNKTYFYPFESIHTDTEIYHGI